MTGAISADAQIDLSRAPLGLRAATALVAAVAASDDRVERHYLEVKSDLDLTRKNDIARIAKFILGAANRLPRVARSAFEGYGVMVIGVAPGHVRGIPPVEMLDLDQVIARYLGASGPRWDVVRVPAAGSSNEVLLVVVDPPQDGQDPFLCRKEGENLFNGRIYVRADGATREANADELDQLIQRGKHHAAPDVSFSVDVVGTARPIVVDDGATIDAYLEKERTRLLSALPASSSLPTKSVLTRDYLGAGSTAESLQQAMKAAQSAQLAAARATSFMTEPEDRTEDEYRNMVDLWESRFREQWVNAIDDIAGYVLAGVSVRVSNATKVFFHEVEAKVHLSGDVRGIDWRNGSGGQVEVELDLPSPPREWGPRARSMFNSMLNSSSFYFPSSDVGSTYQSPLDWDNSGSINLKLSVGELRPRHTFASDDDELVLVLPSGASSEVRGTWEITARDHNEIYVGELTVAVGEPLDLTDPIRGLLGLD
jgi:hypothetical protein